MANHSHAWPSCDVLTVWLRSPCRCQHDSKTSMKPVRPWVQLGIGRIEIGDQSHDASWIFLKQTVRRLVALGWKRT